MNIRISYCYYCTQARRLADEEGIMKSKEKIGEGVRAAKAKLGHVESKL